MPIQVVPQKGRTEAFGDLFGGAMQGIVKGKLLKRQQEQDEAMRIWQMAQQDPLVLQTPQAEQAFKLAGWPKPQITPESQEPSSQDVLNQLRAAKLKYELEQMGAIGGEGEPAAAPAPQPDKPGWWSRLWGGKTASAATPESLVAPPWAAFVPAAEKWLDPRSATPLQATAPSAPGMPTVPTPTSREQSLFSAMDTLRDRGIGVPMPRTAKARKQVPARMAKEPATQQEFEQTVREMAKTDRQKAKAYYDKWVSKWQ